MFTIRFLCLPRALCSKVITYFCLNNARLWYFVLPVADHLVQKGWRISCYACSVVYSVRTKSWCFLSNILCMSFNLHYWIKELARPINGNYERRKVRCINWSIIISIKISLNIVDEDSSRTLYASCRSEHYLEDYQNVESIFMDQQKKNKKQTNVAKHAKQ